LRTNRKSHTRFRLVPNLSTLDDLERPKRTFDWHQIEIENSCGAHQKNLNEDRHKLPVAKCRSMILLSKNMKYICGDSCGRLKDRPSKDISDKTGGISLIVCFLVCDVTSSYLIFTKPAMPDIKCNFVNYLACECE